MSKIHPWISAARWTLALVVAYMFIHAGAHAVTQFAICLSHGDSSQMELIQVGIFGLIQLAAALCLFSSSMILRVASAAILLLVMLSPLAQDLCLAIPGWCLTATALLVLLPQIPRFESRTRRIDVPANG